jgi:hypothetical protein
MLESQRILQNQFFGIRNKNDRLNYKKVRGNLRPFLFYSAEKDGFKSLDLYNEIFFVVY